MSREVITQPNPPPLPSQLPDTVLDLEAHPETKRLAADVRESLADFQHAACYIAAGNYIFRHERDL